MEILDCGSEFDLTAAQYSLCGLQIGEPMQHENLTIFPLSYRGGPKGIVGKETAERKKRYRLLADAIEEKSAKVEELTEGGEVPFLAVDNQGTVPVLIPEGEILIGAKQNRTVNLTVLVGGKSTFKLPVSCVEQGRWSYRSREFDTAAYAAPKLRESKVRSEQFNRRAHGMAVSDQGEVWKQITEHMDDLKAESPSDDFAAAFKPIEHKLAKFHKAIELPEEACGFVAARGEQVIGMDLFDDPETLHKLWERVSNAYLSEALRHGAGRTEADGAASGAEPEPSTPKAAIEQFLVDVADNLVLADDKPLLGTEMELAEGSALAGSALYYDGALVHLAAFGAQG